MITNINNIYKLERKEIGYVIKQIDLISNGDKCPVYIPRLTPSLSFNDIETIFPIRGTQIYKNSNECQIYSDTVLKIQNYVSLPLERNNSWGSDQIVNVVIGYDKEGNEITKQNIKANTQVVCNTKNNIINDSTISTN